MSQLPHPLLCVAAKSAELSALCLKMHNESLYLSDPVSTETPEIWNIDLLTGKLEELNADTARLKKQFEEEIADPDAYKRQDELAF
jgi:hypothetical protein